MKKLSIILPLFALVIAVSSSAFTSSHVSRNAVAWEYVGNGGTEADEQDYVLLDGPPEHTCGGLSTVCTIMAESDLGSPERPILNSQDPFVDKQDFATSTRD